MGNLFDGVKRTAFNVVANTMGYDASWTPSTGGPIQTARVLKQDADNPWGIGNADTTKDEITFYPGDIVVEFLKTEFTGLKAAVDGNNVESLVVDGVTYYVRTVRVKHDGDNVYAVLSDK